MLRFGLLSSTPINMRMPKHLELQQFSRRSGALSDWNAGVPIFFAMTL